MKVAFLAGAENSAVWRAIRAVAAIPGVEVTGIAFCARPRPRCFWEWLRHASEGWMESVCDPAEVRRTLRQAHPDRDYSLADVAARLGVPITSNPPVSDLLIALESDSQPDPCLRLVRGLTPKFDGSAPGFWELWESEKEAGVTVCFEGGKGEVTIRAVARVAIHPLDTPESLDEKLAELGAVTLAAAVRDLQNGAAHQEPAPAALIPRGLPQPRDRRALARKLPHWRYLDDSRVAAKNLLSLALFHGGVFALRRMGSRSRQKAAILLYHRVNDFSNDPLTTSTRRFVQHLLTVRRFYRAVSTESLTRGVQGREPFPAGAIAIHFDDCYRDVLTDAAPILRALGIPAMFFVSTGFLDTDRVFEHDRAKYPQRFPNLSRVDLREWVAQGFEVGAHTVNHIDLGAASSETARLEIEESGRELRSLTGLPVTAFAFPFGTPKHFRPEYRRHIVDSGYDSLFSAHGGFITAGCDPLDIPRIGISSDNSPIGLLLDLEDLSPIRLLGGQRARWTGTRGSPDPPSQPTTRPI